jgi:hypothetical protein
MGKTKQTTREQIISWLPFTGTNKYMGAVEKIMKEAYNVTVMAAMASLTLSGGFNIYFKNGSGSTPSWEETKQIIERQNKREENLYDIKTTHQVNHRRIEDIE